MSPLLTAAQAGELFNVPPSWLMRQARAGTVPHLKLGHYTRFEQAALEDWLGTQRRGA